MPRTIHFNTGRLYSSGGQRITATYHDDSYVTFFDHTRLVDGGYQSHYDEDDFDQASVMSMYDAGRAQSSKRSFTDGMTIGGCNTRFKGE